MSTSITVLCTAADTSTCGIARFSSALYEELRKITETKLIKFGNKVICLDKNEHLVFNYPGLGLYGNKKLMLTIGCFRLRGGKILMINHEIPSSLKEKLIYWYFWLLSNIVVSPRLIRLSSIEKFVTKKIRLLPNFSLLSSDGLCKGIRKLALPPKRCCTFGHIHRGKKIENLISFAALNKLELKVVGGVQDKLYQDELNLLASKLHVKLSFLPYLEDRELFVVLGDHDFVIFYGSLEDASWSTTIQAVFELGLITVLVHDSASLSNYGDKIFTLSPQHDVMGLLEVPCAIPANFPRIMTPRKYARKIFSIINSCFVK